MRKIFGFTHMEIARRLHISHRTVEQHLTKGLKRCQESLAETPPGGRAQDRRLG